MTNKAYFDKLRNVINRTGEVYFIDSTKANVDSKEIPYWNTTLMAFAYAGRMNTLLIGDKGTGKTTLAELLASLMTSLPFDLFARSKIQGHPEQTMDSMFMRTDIGKLVGPPHEESVIIQPVLYLPVIHFDELNRCTSGKQSIGLELIRTGFIEHLGHDFETGKVPWVATMNPNGPGTYPLPAGSLDRFNLGLEIAYLTELEMDLVLDCEERTVADLWDPDMTKAIKKTLLDKTVSAQEKREFISQKQATFARTHLAALKQDGSLSSPLEPVPFLTPAEKLFVQRTPFEPYAKSLLRCITAEINRTVQYGSNRSEDLRDNSTHNSAFASANILEGNQRFYTDVQFFAGMLARYSGRERVSIDDVMAVTPHVLCHRLEFTQDYRSKFAKIPRLQGENEKTDLTRRLIGTVKDHYAGMKDDLHTLDMVWGWASAGNAANAVSPSQNQLALAYYFVMTNSVIDHPYLRSIIATLKDLKTQERIEAHQDAQAIKNLSAAFGTARAPKTAP